MIKRLLPLLFCLLSVPAYAVPPDHVVAYPVGTPLAFNPTPGYPVSQACDQYGVCQVSIAASAITTPGSVAISAASGYATGTLDMTNAAATTDFTCGVYGSVGVRVSGGVSGTVYFKQSGDGVTYTDRGFVSQWKGGGVWPYATSATPGTSAGSDYLIDCSGTKFLRAYVSSTGTGTATVYWSPKIAALFQIATGMYGAGNANSILKNGGGTPGATDAGVAGMYWTNSNLGAGINTANKWGYAAVETNGATYSIPMASSNSNSATKSEDAAHTSGDGGMAVLAVRNDGFGALSGTNLDYTPIGVTSGGAVGSIPMYDGNLNGNLSLIERQGASYATSNAGAKIVSRNLAAPVSGGGDGVYNILQSNDVSALYTDAVRRSAFVTTTPSITNTTSFTTLAANTARRFFRIQNDSAANICCSENNASLTGIVPTSTNICEVITPGSSIQSPSNAVPTAAITCYQSSGGTINTVVVVEQS